MRTMLTIALALLIGACATNAPQPRYVSPGGDDGSFALTSLNEASLPAGKCGMILWTLDANAPTRILRYVSGENAEIAINGAPVTLSLAETSGGSNFGVFERQVFVGGAGYDASVDVNFGLGFDGGAYLERGLITVRSSTGWEIVAPAAGIAGCRGK